MLFVSAVIQSSVFAFFAVVNVVNELSVPVDAYSSYNEESNLPISAQALLPRVSTSPRYHDIKQAPTSNKHSLFPRFLNE